MKKNPNFVPAKTVDEYLNRLPDEIKTSLQELRQIVIAAAPDAQEVISYQIPGYKQNGPVVFFGAFTGHCSLFVINKNILKQFSSELMPFKTSGTTIHFHPGNPLPAALVKNIVQIRLQQNQGLKP